MSLRMINGQEVEFLEFPEKGVVVCKLSGCGDIPVVRIEKYTRNKVDPYVYQRYTIDDTFVGVAKCSPEDTFDLEYGRKLALIKAKSKRGAAINKALQRYKSDTLQDLMRLAEEGIHPVPDPKEFIDKKKN